ncbi:hypothetical protein BGZ76_005078 [Entomortierella beljakovae]|nr:hypothetical protein BGZ76_005078 [Entomortierella beljakovae]
MGQTSITPSIELPSGASSPTKSYFRSPWKSYQGIQRARGPGSDTGSVSASESGRASSVIKEPIARLSAGIKASVFSSGYIVDSGNISESGSGSGTGVAPSKTKSKDKYRLSVDKLGFRDSQKRSQQQKQLQHQNQHQSHLDQTQASIEWTMTPSSPPTAPIREKSLQPSESLSQIIQSNHGEDSHHITREKSPCSDLEVDRNSNLPSFVTRFKGKSPPILLDTYFTLHDQANDTIIYTSETVLFSNNPKYSPLEEHKFTDPSKRRSSHVVIRIWGGLCESDYVVLLEWRIDLCCLRFIGKELQDLPTSLPNNTILFEFTNGFYTAPDEDDVSEHPHTSLEPSSGAIVYGAVPSYTYDSVMRLNNLHECIADTKRSRDEIKHNIELALNKESAPLIMQKRRGECTERLWHLQRQVGHELNELEAAQEKAAALRKQHAERRKAMSESRERGQTQEMYLEENVTKLIQSKESLFNTLKEYSTKRRELIATLFTIFPITESETDPGLLMICNIPLPNSVYVGLDDEPIAIALGLTCHLVTMLAHYLSLPLRYPITPMGCRAFIYDPVSILVGPREFPLYGKGQERYRFEYGVFLLNKNVEQLLNSQGLNFMDLRQTLPNLRYLMETLLTSSPTSKVIGRSRQDRREQERLNDLFIISVEQREFEQILHPSPNLDSKEGSSNGQGTGAGKGSHSRAPSNSKATSGSERSSLLREYDPIDGDYMLILDNASTRSPRSQKETISNGIPTIEGIEEQFDTVLAVSMKAKNQQLSRISSGLRHGYTSSSSIGETDNEDEDRDEDRYSEGIDDPAFKDWASEAVDSSNNSGIDLAINISVGHSDVTSNHSKLDSGMQDDDDGGYGQRTNTASPTKFLVQVSRTESDSFHKPLNTGSIQGSDIETDVDDAASPPPPASAAVILPKDDHLIHSNETNNVLFGEKVDGDLQNNLDDQLPDQGLSTKDISFSLSPVPLAKDKPAGLGYRGRRVNNQNNGDGDQLNSKKQQQTIQTSPISTITPSLGASS